MDVRTAAGEHPLRGKLIIGAERLFGYVSSDLSLSPTQDDEFADEGAADTNVSSFSFLGSARTEGYALPGLALDAVLQSGLSLGGSLSAYTGSLSSGDETLGEFSGFGIHPRVGFAFDAPRFALWPRVGVAYHSRNAQSSSTIALELPVVFPSESGSYAVSVTPAYYLPWSGQVTSGTQHRDATVSTFLFTFGIHLML